MPRSPRAGTLVFCHANGFPASTYSVLLQAWRAAGWRVLAPEKFGHDPAHPPSSGWPHLRDELLAFIDRHCGAEPVVLVGHSMGGYLSLLAASRRPAAVQAVVLLDAPIVSGWRSHTFHMLKLSGLIARAGPGKVAVRRRVHWPDAHALREHFSHKSTFARWDKRVLADYLRHGFVPQRDGGGLTLAFERDIEARIYNTLPHHVPAQLQRHPLRCPVSYVAGTRSRESRQLGLQFVRRLAGPRWRTIEGTHLFPMERPLETARTVLALLAPGTDEAKAAAGPGHAARAGRAEAAGEAAVTADGAGATGAAHAGSAGSAGSAASAASAATAPSAAGANAPGASAGQTSAVAAAASSGSARRGR